MSLDDNNIYELSFTNSKFEIIGDCEMGQIGDMCEIMAPNWPSLSFNNGFLIKNIVTDDLFQVIDEFSKEDRERQADLMNVNFYVIDWDTFKQLFKKI